MIKKTFPNSKIDAVPSDQKKDLGSASESDSPFSTSSFSYSPLTHSAIKLVDLGHSPSTSPVFAVKPVLIDFDAFIPASPITNSRGSAETFSPPFLSERCRSEIERGD